MSVLPAHVPSALQLAILITFDRLPLAGLGCYGNEWVDTTACDTLAAEGFVFDANIATQAPESASDVAAISAGWLQQILTAGGGATLIREPGARTIPDIPAGCQILNCPPGNEPPATALDLPFAQLILSAQAWLRSHRSQPSIHPTVLWLHSAGLLDDCIPPTEAWDLYADEFAEEGIDWTTLSDEAMLAHPAIRAAYLSLMDHWLGEWLAAIRNVEQPVLLQICGLAGWPWLPAPRRVPVPANLDAASIRAPWILWENLRRDKAKMWEPGRSMAIVQPCDAGPTMLEWLGLVPEIATREHSLWPVIRGEESQVRPYGLTRGTNDACSVWTPADQVVFFTESGETGALEQGGVRRYWQPEDPWNVFDTASESPDRIEEVRAWLQPTQE